MKVQAYIITLHVALHHYIVWVDEGIDELGWQVRESLCSATSTCMVISSDIILPFLSGKKHINLIKNNLMLRVNSLQFSCIYIIYNRHVDRAKDQVGTCKCGSLDVYSTGEW